MDWRKNYRNVMTYAAGCDKYFEDKMRELGKEKITTFFSDLGTAEWYGEKAVNETYRDVVGSWIGDYKYFSEFVLALNWKCWYWYDRDNNLSRLYSDLFYKAKDKFYSHYKDNQEACDYFFELTD